MEEKKIYIVSGMMAKCSEGSMENYLSTDTGHGIVYQGQPVLNANDHVKGVNLTHFGDCHSKAIYEQAKKDADEKYKAEEGDGFFTKLEKWRLKTVTKLAISFKEHLSFNKCELDTPLPWIFVSKDHMIDGAPALTIDSQCTCRYGGTISIVPPTEGDGAITGGIADRLMAEAKEAIAEQEAAEAAEEAAAVPDEMEFINKYVNEEAMAAINPRWDAQALKAQYGDNVFQELRDSMYNAGITGERSVLMFLCTLGEESGYGTITTEAYTAAYLAGKNYTVETRGAGLIQVTGDTQKNFLEYVSNALPAGSEKTEVENYINGYATVNGKCVNNYGNATEFIANNYPIQSATWFWGVQKESVATFQKDAITQNVTQTDMTINEWVENFSNTNQDNLFLTTQYAVNGRKGLSKGDLEDMCKSSADIWSVGDTSVSINGKTKDLPNGWTGRREDWENAKGMIK
jgi:hypothetical protein